MNSDLVKGNFDKYLRDIAIKIYENHGESELRMTFNYSPTKMVMNISNPLHPYELISEYVRMITQMKFENKISFFTVSYNGEYLTVHLTQ